MNVQDVFRLPLRFRPWIPRHLRLIVEDLLGTGRQPVQDHRIHLDATIEWLCRAQDIREGRADSGSVSAGWSFEDGWLPGYPETTGYIIETFLAAAALCQRKDLIDRANRMIDWELSLQSEEGAFPGHFGEPGSHPVIFNQGQIMHGLVAGYTQLGRLDCLEAGLRAGRWLVAQQDEDGCFRRFEHNGVPHVYNTRALWALAALGTLTGEEAFRASARRNLDWALSQQQPSGWFAINAFKPGQDPFTHTIAYAIRGLLEGSVILNDERFFLAARSAADGVLATQREDGWLAGSFADDWIPTASYTCVTGVAQMALCWIRLFQICGIPHYKDAANRAIRYVKTIQRLTDPDPLIRGGIPGSAPIWGAYSRLEFPNWAAKFFADALIMDISGTPLPPSPPSVNGREP